MSHGSRIFAISFLLLTLGLCLCFAATLEREASEPPNVAVQSPDPSLPAAVNALLGRWTGKWNSYWDAIIVIEKVSADSAQVVFAWGDYNTSHGTCHCGPNWVRVTNAKLTYKNDKATLNFYTPKFRPRWLKESHTVTGAYEETYHAQGSSSGRYTYTFVLQAREPKIIKGDFASARDSRLHIKLQKTE